MLLDNRNASKSGHVIPDAMHRRRAEATRLRSVGGQFKFGFHSFSTSQGNPWIEEVTAHHPWGYNLIMNPETARQRGIADGDNVSVENCEGETFKGTVNVTQGIHPEVVGVGACFGRWSRGEPLSRGERHPLQQPHPA